MKIAVVTPVSPSRENTTLPTALRSIDGVREGDGRVLPLVVRLTIRGDDSGSSKLNRGVAEAISRGCTHYLFLADDDALMPGWYRAHIEGLLKNPEADFVYGDILAVDKTGEPLSVWSPPPYTDAGLLREPTLPGVGLISVRVWQRAGGYRDVPYGADWLMFAHAAPLNVERIRGAWYCHRQWDQTETAKGDRKPLMDELERLRTK